MEIALMVGIIPVLYSVASDKSGYYVGRALWFGLTSIYSMVVYVVQMPWYHIYEDFNCHGNITYPCLMECFEQMFSIPIAEMWCFIYFIFVASFFLMEFFMAQIRHKHVKVKVTSPQKRENAGEMEKGSMETVKKQSPSWMTSTLNFHQEKTLLYLYLLHFLLQVSIQIVFLCLLIFEHLPVVSQNNIHCSTNNCPGPYRCRLWETSEKQLSIYALSTMSTVIIICGMGCFVYNIYYYLLRVRSASKVWIS